MSEEGAHLISLHLSAAFPVQTSTKAARQSSEDFLVRQKKALEMAALLEAKEAKEAKLISSPRTPSSIPSCRDGGYACAFNQQQYHGVPGAHGTGRPFGQQQGQYQQSPPPSQYQQGPSPFGQYQQIPSWQYQEASTPAQYQQGPPTGQYHQGFPPSGQYQQQEPRLSRQQTDVSCYPPTVLNAKTGQFNKQQIQQGPPASYDQAYFAPQNQRSPFAALQQLYTGSTAAISAGSYQQTAPAPQPTFQQPSQTFNQPPGKPFGSTGPDLRAPTPNPPQVGGRLSRPPPWGSSQNLNNNVYTGSNPPPWTSSQALNAGFPGGAPQGPVGNRRI